MDLEFKQLDNIDDYKRLIKHHLKVSNPELLKTGTFATLINVLHNIKHDTKSYYTSLLRELNPSTAMNLDSLQFHNSLVGNGIEFSIPSKYDIKILLPKLDLIKGESLEYNIPKGRVITDKNEIPLTIKNDINIKIDNHGIDAFQIDDTKNTQKLRINKIRNPNNENQDLYLIDVNQIKQEIKIENLMEIPYYDVGERVEFKIDIGSYKPENISNIYNWVLSRDDLNEELYDFAVDMDTITKYDPEKLNLIGYKRMSTKLTSTNSSYVDDDIFLRMKQDDLIIRLPDGRNGRKLKTGDILVTVVELTLGTTGSGSQYDGILPEVNVTNKLDDNTMDNTQIALKILSPDGGYGAKDMNDPDTIRKNIQSKMTARKAIVSVNDFEIEFKSNGIEPVVDTKFFNSKSHLFLYNTITDSNGSIVKTTSINIPEIEFDTKLFLPTKTVGGVELISPFYYKKHLSHYKSYLINPEVSIKLRLSKQNQNIQSVIPELTLNYDYVTKKSTIKLKNAKPKFTYYLTTNIFNITLDQNNNFESVIDNIFTDEYCIIDFAPIFIDLGIKNQFLDDMILSVYDMSYMDIETYNSIGESDILYQDFVAEYTNINTAKQLIEKQDIYQYIELDMFNTNREYRHSISVPFLDINFFNGTGQYKTNSNILTQDDNFKRKYELLDELFKLDTFKSSKRLPYNLSATQAFYNTIKIEPLYEDIVFSKNNNPTNGPMFEVRLEIIFDKERLFRSEYDDIEEITFDIKRLIIRLLKPSHGHAVEFYETTLEHSIREKYGDVINNVDIISPKVFYTKDNNYIYSKLEDHIGENRLLTDVLGVQSDTFDNIPDNDVEGKYGYLGLYKESKPNDLGVVGFDWMVELTVKHMIDYVPNYFHFDTNNIEIKSILN